MARKLATLLLLLTVVISTLAVPRAMAQDDAPGGSFITPFPAGDLYKVQIVGDGLAEGLLAGLVEALASDSRLQINRKHRIVSGLTRFELDDELPLLDDVLARDPHHITIVMVGRDDRVPIRLANNKRLAIGKDDWREEYGRRVDRLVKLLKKRGGAVYWVGLPVVRRFEWNDDIQVMNDIVRERVYLNGIKFVDAFTGFADEGGNFNAYGPDATGNMRVMRSSDGIGFTPAGNRKLAHFVEREIKRDLTQAKNERAIPLAGSEVEQRKINPLKAVAEVAPTAQAITANKPVESKSSWAATTNVAPQPTPQVASTALEQKADNSRISVRLAAVGGREETVTLDILRPAIPASVIQLIARNATPDKATQMGDTMQEPVTGGLIVLSSVSPALDGGTGGRRAKLAPTQTPYFKVMVKGERLPPKPGRADDFRWPRRDVEIDAPPPAVSAAPQTLPLPVPQPKAVPATTQRILQQRQPPQSTLPRQ